MRVVTYGRQPTTAPPGTFREVHFPQLALLDKGTNEGFISRILASDGADVRSLPRTISFQELDTFGHDMAAAVGALHEVTVDGETGILSGKGWLADDEWGHKAALAILSQKLFHNSIDLAEVTKVRYDEKGDYWDDDFHVDITFEEWKLGKTTIVALPAFADAHAVLVNELAAALAETTPLIVEAASAMFGGSPLELQAALPASPKPKHAYFHRPESEHFTAITVGEPDEDGWIPVYGHFSDWTKLHRNASGQLVPPPRGRDGYAHFCASKVLTDKGMVKVGPVTLLGGHVTLQQAIEDIENTWADVRVIDGVLGHWMSGVVRPHVAADLAKTYAARASQVSGYWPDGSTLRLICSVNAGGFPVLEAATDGEFALAASLDATSVVPADALSFMPMSDRAKMQVHEWVKEALAAQGPQPGTTTHSIMTGETEATMTITTEVTIEIDDESAGTGEHDDYDAEGAHLARLRELELETEPA